MASTKAFEDLDLSQDEIKRLGEALKKEEFRKLLCEYAEEISDPANKARYEEEIREMEAGRGMDVQFVHPEGGYVMKTVVVEGSLTSGKAFINIATSDLIGKPSMDRRPGPDGKVGTSWQLPHSLAPPREDLDNSKNKCHIFDFVIHPDTYRMAETNARFRKMVEDTAFDTIERSFDVKFDRKNVKYPKMKFKGTPTPTVIRSKKKDGSSESKENQDPDNPINKFPYPYDNKTTAEKSKEVEEAAKKREAAKKNADSKTSKTTSKPDSEFTEPKYTIKHRNELDMSDFRNAPDARTSTRPTQLVVEIHLPLCKSAAGVDLDIFEQRLKLEFSKTAKYKLDIKLPYPVDENEGSAKFDKGKKTLIVTLPVVPDKSPKIPFTSEPEAKDSKSEELSLSTEGPAIPGLIEVLSSQEFSEKTAEEVDPPKATSPQPAAEIPQSANKSSEEETEATRPATIPEVSYTFPEFNYSQDHETASFILNVRNAKRDKLTVDHTTTTCDVRLVSIGEGGFPLHYRFYLEFPATCTFEQDNVQTDISEDNVVLLLEKCDDSIGLWDTFKVGLNNTSLEEKLFLTVFNAQKELDALDREQADVEGAGEQEDLPELEVTAMDQDRLTIHIKNAEEAKGKRKKRMSESADDIEVVHEREVPRIPGILKQRSRTQSESSCDELVATPPGYQRQHSSASFSGSFSSSLSGSAESSVLESDENGEGRKKSVSFSEHIDQASYKSNASVNTLKATLKNKRRKQRKRETKREARVEKSRRRRTSSCSEPSSDDQSGSVSSLERSNSLDDLEDPDSDPEEVMTSVTGTGNKQAVESVKVTASPGEGDSKVRTNETSSADDYGTNPTTTTTNSSTKPAENGDTSSASSGNNTAKSKKRNKKNKKQKENGGERTGESEAVQNQNEAAENEKNADKPETILSWEDRKEVLDPLGAHAPKCAFSFSNSVIYDLDVE